MNWIKQLFGGWREKRQVSMSAKLDHVELSEAHLVLGLEIDWGNKTNEPIPIKEIKVKIHLDGRGGEPLRFYPLDRFGRVLNKARILKMPVRPLTLPAGEVHTEHLRFISQEVVDIPVGGYAVDIELTDTSNNSYASRTKIRVENGIKYRRSEEWQEG